MMVFVAERTEVVFAPPVLVDPRAPARSSRAYIPRASALCDRDLVRRTGVDTSWVAHAA